MSYPEEIARDHPILNEVLLERMAQDKKWGERNHDPMTWIVILTEEVGEAAKEVLCCYPNSLAQYRKEMIQVAAVACAAIESLDRGKWFSGDYK